MNLRRLTQFPPLESIKQLDGFINDSKSSTSGLLSFEVKKTNRPEIVAPFSFFSNLKGESHCRIDKRKFTVNENALLVMNRGQEYDLKIDNPSGTVIQNMHINESIMQQAYTSLISRQENLLDGDSLLKGYEFTTGILPKPAALTHILSKTNQLAHFEETSNSDIMMRIADVLLSANHEVTKQYYRLPAISALVKNELQRRMNEAKDYIWSNYRSELNLDELCREIGMSKFHFLRVFKTCFQLTPYQYLVNVRHDKAKFMLKNTNREVQDISFALGFEIINSFSKSFRKIEGISPSDYRLLNK